MGWSTAKKVNCKEVICGYGSGSFKAAELNYPSSHKEILAVKKTFSHFILFLKPVKFIIRTDLNIMPSIFKNENLIAENSSRILKWFIWLSNFDFDIVYKPRRLNYIADMLTREQNSKPALNMFSVGESSSGAQKDKGKAPVTEDELEKLRAKEGLFLLPWDNSIPKNVRINRIKIVPSIG